MEKILDFVYSFIKNIPNKTEQSEIKKYEKTMQSEAFIAYQEKVLRHYYGEEHCTKVFHRTYPVYAIPGHVAYPFHALIETGFDEDKKLDFKKGKYYRKYKRVVGRNIRRPLMQGFMLDHFELNPQNEIVGMHTWVGTYEQNVYTSHILEYEIYDLFRKK